MTGFDGLDRPGAPERSSGLGRLVEALGVPAASRVGEQRRRFVSAASRGDGGRRGASLALLAAAALVVLAVAGGGWVALAGRGAPSSPLAAGVQEDRWLEGARQSGVVRLLDGASVRLSAKARARVQGLSGAEPLVTLEDGRVDADLEPRLGKQWTFLAGAYRIQVLGTAFSIEYEPDSGAIEVAVDRGRVRVSGGSLGSEGVTLDSGQHFRARGAVVSFGMEGRRADDQAEEQRASAAPSATSGPSELATSPRGPSPQEAGPSVLGPAAADGAPPTPGWHSLFRRGDFAAALAAAEAEGFERLVARLGPSELGDLADTARLAGSPARARQALMAVRSRFQGGAGAARAAFLLGRMEGSPHWFETYLGEQPRGPYAAEAAGRLVVAYRDHGDPGRARTAAERYLARYPGGPYADLARSLVANQAPSR